MTSPLAAAPALVSALDLFGIAVFAASGALAAARQRQTLVTFAFFALVTGTGGGTVRDLLIGAQVFWVNDWRFPATCLVTALLVWVTPARLWNDRALDWFDAVGLAVYAVFGTWKAMSVGIGPLPSVMMGVVTACVGGIIRDVLANEPSILLRPEIYVTAAALAAGIYVALVTAGIDTGLAAVVGTVAGFGLRGLAIVRGLAIPSYRPRE